MSDKTEFTASAEAVSVSPAKKPETMREFIARLKDPLRWKSAVMDLALWFMFGLVVTQMLSMYSPGYPLIVGTPSIPTGLYWADTRASVGRNDLITFPFEPTQEFLKGRYGRELVHTKILKGLPGDTIYADADQKLTLCPGADATGRVLPCESVGQAFAKDSKGRPLYSWVPPKHQYTLRDGEYWVYATHERSLDSRYHGPIAASSVKGRVTPVLLFKIGE